MYEGQTVLCRLNGKVIECVVISLFYEDVLLSYNGEQFQKKYWEIKKIDQKGDKNDR